MARNQWQEIKRIEALLWREISGKKLNGLDFDRQKIIGNYIVDFFCASNLIVVEIDDKSTHDNKWKYDEKRDEYLRGLGLTVIHIAASDVLKNPHDVFVGLSNHPAFQAPLQRRGTGPATDDTKFPSAEGWPQAGVVSGDNVTLVDRHIRDFVDYLQPGDAILWIIYSPATLLCLIIRA